MKNNPSALKRLLDRLDRRLKKSRPASVLILVVALLVLMALIGTAFITTTGTDRYSAAQHAVNTEIDMLLEGVVDMAEGALVKDLLVGQQYRSTGVGYVPVDHPGLDRHLASRMPAPSGVGGVPAVWPYTSGSPIESGPVAPSTVIPPEFEMPWNGEGGALGFGQRPDKPFHKARLMMGPTYVDLPQPDGKTRRFPALVSGDTTCPFNSEGKTYLAADTDGDGIADASLFRLGKGQVNGVTYYAAVRLVDNGGGVNVNVATKVNTEAFGAPATGPLQGDFFPTNLDLLSMLVGARGQPVQFNPQPGTPQMQQLERLMDYRYNGVVRPNPPRISFAKRQAKDDQGKIRGDFEFYSPYEELWFRLGTRVSNPGTHPAGRFHALDPNEQAHLASGFTVNLNSSSSTSVLQQALAPSLAVRTRPYQPEEVGLWFNENFRFEASPGGAVLQAPIGPLLVVRNPTADYVTDIKMVYAGRNVTKFRYRGPWLPNEQYEMGDWVTRTIPQDPMPATLRPPGAPNTWTPEVQAFMCLRDNTNSEPAAMSGAWAWMPWTNAPKKLNLNTATFGQLYAYYYAMMKDANLVYPRQGTSPSDPPPYDQWGPFRNPLVRTAPPGGEALSAWQMAQVRAALAAVNTIDLRDADQEVTSRSLVLLEKPGTPPNEKTLYVDVYGSEPQPFITEVLVHLYADGRSYVAIELVNPSPVAIDLRQWKLATMERVDIVAGGMKPREILNFSNLNAQMSIAPNQRIVIESSAHRPLDLEPIAKAPDGTTYPAPYNETFKSDQLHTLVATGASEMILMRPRRPGGALTKSAAGVQENIFDENAGQPEYPIDYVPVDQLDFQGIKASPVDPDTFQPIDRRYHYARGDTYGHWVWPGNYDPAGGYLPGPGEDPNASAKLGLRHEGWRVDPGRSPAGPYLPPAFYPGGFWKPKQPFNPMWVQEPEHSTYVTQAVHLAAKDTPGPFGLGSGAMSRFPFGGFSRTGDIMHVPFIGGYRIRNKDNTTQNPPTCIELHAVTMDTLRADDATPGPGGTERLTPPREQLGRFVPIDRDRSVPPVPGEIDDTEIPPQMRNKPQYAWATDMFDLFTAMDPGHDFMPNVDPGNDPTVEGSPAKWPVERPEEIANGQPVRIWHKANWGREDGAGYDGRININTAHWRVLAAVPMVPFKNQPNWFTLNADLARAIVHYRDVNNGTGAPHGPFKSLWELNRVYDVINGDITKTFQNGWGQIALTADIDDADGDISPVGQGNRDNLPGGFETRYAMINRISNFLSAQSDSYTMYVMVQGWRNAGSSTPELVAVRRQAAVVDRAGVHPRTVGAVPPGSLPMDPDEPVRATGVRIIPIPQQE